VQADTSFRSPFGVDWGKSWVSKILASKVHLSIAGGDSFSDIYGLRRFIYVALPQILVLLLGKPLVLLPQTYGPLKGRCSRMIARFIFRRAALICSGMRLAAG